MQAKITFTLGIISALLSVDQAVYAQSNLAQPQPGSFTLSGESLLNIDYRSAQNDFGRFFNQQNPGNTSKNPSQQNLIYEELPLGESISIPSNAIFLQPANQTINGNDGLQLQLDVSDDQ
ncbi:hypothetical protein [Anabaena sp. PCC 7108]|uniref:hypothetical protein n=1 Tax=Anabaena sp. PCC 7108 TaxID=163908 RepID=UPI00034644B3|nr:hypothetical protein [Anabaena sp. PCC 7108]